MPRDQIFADLRELMVKVTTIPGRARSESPFFTDPDRIKPETLLAELALDSIMIAALVREVEAHFDINLSPVLMFEVQTVEDLVVQIETECKRSAP